MNWEKPTLRKMMPQRQKCILRNTSTWEGRKRTKCETFWIESKNKQGQLKKTQPSPKICDGVLRGGKGCCLTSSYVMTHEDRKRLMKKRTNSNSHFKSGVFLAIEQRQQGLERPDWIVVSEG